MPARSISRVAIPPHDVTYQEWTNYVHHGSLRLEHVRPEIRNSWERCRAFGVDPLTVHDPAVMPAARLDALRETHAELIDIAHPFMENLYNFVSGSGLIVFLADTQGVILENIGDFVTTSSASQVKLIPGVSWKEEAVGTNGIGTALLLRRPIQISGAEHYCSMLHEWTCSAAPILNSDGEILGILQISGSSCEAHLHTLGMVVAATAAIKEQLRIQDHHREMIVLNNSMDKIFQTMSDGAIIVNQYGVITNINSVGRQIVGNNPIGVSIRNLFSQHALIADILDNGSDFTDVEMIIEASRTHFHCLVTGKIIRNARNTISGAVVFINPMSKIKKIINRFSSSQANFEFNDIIGTNVKLREAVQGAINASTSISNILITGESGTGKELFAQSIHNRSPRSGGPFVAINCAALPRDLISSELFGYADGAFTGARRGGRPGKFEMASGGTLFLDEIGDMPLDQQPTLLRVLQEKKVTRIGGDHIIPVDVRIICATNRNLQHAVAQGHFRSDLYYRLNVIHIPIPPLRERLDDIKQLVTFFVAKIGEKLGSTVRDTDPSVIRQLMDYSWPGNVRELENVVEKMLNACKRDRIGVTDLPVCIADPETGQKCPICVEKFAGTEKNINTLITEKQQIVDLLDRHRGNISSVAKNLGISRNTVYRKLVFYNITRENMFR